MNTLLNPCHCKDVYSCTCGAKPTQTPSSSSCCQKSSASPTNPPRDSQPIRGPDLPPIIMTASSSSSIFAVPSIPIPHMETFTKLAGTGCGCGIDCICPGCTEHRGAHASAEEDCPDLCGSCVDHREGYGLHGQPSEPSLQTLQKFLAVAASLPPPPHRRNNLDLHNIMQYGNPGSEPVGIPKLKCCAGKCKCAPSSCCCGDSCGGACQRDESEDDTMRFHDSTDLTSSCCS